MARAPTCATRSWNCCSNLCRAQATQSSKLVQRSAAQVVVQSGRYRASAATCPHGAQTKPTQRACDQHLHHLLQLLARGCIAAGLDGCAEAAARVSVTQGMGATTHVQILRARIAPPPPPPPSAKQTETNALWMYFSGSARKAFASAGDFSSRPSNSELGVKRVDAMSGGGTWPRTRRCPGGSREPPQLTVRR